MQSIRYLEKWLNQNRSTDRILFTPSDLRGLFPNLSLASFKTLISRSTSSGLLGRVCRGVYYVKTQQAAQTDILFHTAALLRANHFNYLSLETILSEHSIISQIPTHWITLISSGRSNTVNCGEFGTIEFVHTNRQPEELSNSLSYDTRYGLWRANATLALSDMKRMRRDMDLIDWEIADEFI